MLREVSELIYRPDRMQLRHCENVLYWAILWRHFVVKKLKRFQLPRQTPYRGFAPVFS